MLKFKLVDYIRDHLGLKGTKYGCGNGICGACTVLVDNVAVRACSVNVAHVLSVKVTTIEGLAALTPEDEMHPLQKSWVELGVPQCGYCQPGQLMSAAALLLTNPKPNDQDISSAMSGNLCRCGTYRRIYQAILRATRENYND
jgi:isoquinoline 1-oxidoreductase alpha subunit